MDSDDSGAAGPWRELTDSGEEIARTGTAVAWVLQNRYVCSTYVAVASVKELEDALEDL